MAKSLFEFEITYFKLSGKYYLWSCCLTDKRGIIFKHINLRF